MCAHTCKVPEPSPKTPVCPRVSSAAGQTGAEHRRRLHVADMTGQGSTLDQPGPQRPSWKRDPPLGLRELEEGKRRQVTEIALTQGLARGSLQEQHLLSTRQMWSYYTVWRTDTSLPLQRVSFSFSAGAHHMRTPAATSPGQHRPTLPSQVHLLACPVSLGRPFQKFVVSAGICSSPTSAKAH